MTSSKLLTLYLNYCKTNKRLNDHTIKAYTIDLKQFICYLNSSKITKVTSITIEKYISEMHNKYKPKTVRRKTASLKAFYHYLECKDYILVSPFSKIDLKFRTPVVLPKTIPLSSLEAILKAAYAEKENGSTAIKRLNSIRNIAVLELLFATGIRISELCSLRPKSIDINNHILLIHGKGAKERLLQIENESALAALKDYYDKYKDPILKCNYFFANRNGTPLSDQSARRIIRHYTKLASLSQHITPHMFRHTFASSLLDAGVDLRYIHPSYPFQTNSKPFSLFGFFPYTEYMTYQNFQIVRVIVQLQSP